MDSLISKMMGHGQVHPQKLHALGDTGSKIALANENTVHKEGSEGPSPAIFTADANCLICVSCVMYHATMCTGACPSCWMLADDTQEAISREAATKKADEATHKQDSEERHKILAEETEKKMDLKRREIKQEERNKNFEDDLEVRTSHDL